MKNENTCIDYGKVDTSRHVLNNMLNTPILNGAALSSIATDFRQISNKHAHCLFSMLEGLDEAENKLKNEGRKLENLAGYLTASLTSFEAAESGMIINKEKFQDFIKNSAIYNFDEKKNILDSDLVFSTDSSTFQQNMSDDIRKKISEQTNATVVNFASNGKDNLIPRSELVENFNSNIVEEMLKDPYKTGATETTIPPNTGGDGGTPGTSSSNNNGVRYRVQEEQVSSNSDAQLRENPSSNTKPIPAPGENGDVPGNNTGGNETTKPENPGNNTGGNETPKPENPGNNTGGNETPKPENPGNNTGGNETPKPENPGNNGNTNTGGNTNNNQGTAQRPSNNSGNHVSYNPSGSNNQQGATSGPTEAPGEAPSTGTTVPTPKPDTSGDMDIISIDKTPAKDTASASASSGGSNVIPIALGVAAAGAAAVAGTRFIKKRSEQQNDNGEEEDNYQIEDENLLKDLDGKIESSTSMQKESLDANSLSSLDDLTNTKQSQEIEQKTVSVPNQELNFAQPESSFKYQAGSVNKLNLEDGRDVRIEDETVYGTNKEELE